MKRKNWQLAGLTMISREEFTGEASRARRSGQREEQRIPAMLFWCHGLGVFSYFDIAVFMFVHPRRHQFRYSHRTASLTACVDMTEFHHSE
jgi:hypothetical protein